MCLTGKVAVVTGSTQGLGLIIAEQLARNGCSVITTGSRSKEAATTIVNHIRTLYVAHVKEASTTVVNHIRTLSGTTVNYIKCDLRKKTDTDELYNKVLDIYDDGIDILVNNAGIAYKAPVTEMPYEEWNRQIDVNLTAPFYLIRQFVPFMKMKKWGRIVNISSRYGMVGLENSSAYVSSKHGLVGLTKAVALETAEFGITCNSVNVGAIDTPLTQRIVEEMEKYSGMSKETILDSLRSQIPTKTIATTREIAEYIIFLCSSGAENMTGTVVPIDGGYTAK